MAVYEVNKVDHALTSFMGIKIITVKDETIDISYDLLETILQKIEEKLMDIGSAAITINHHIRCIYLTRASNIGAKI